MLNGYDTEFCETKVPSERRIYAAPWGCKKEQRPRMIQTGGCDSVVRQMQREYQREYGAIMCNRKISVMI